MCSASPAIETVREQSTIRSIVSPFFARYAVLASTLGMIDCSIHVDDPVLQCSIVFSTLQDVRSVLYTLMRNGHVIIRMAGMWVARREGTHSRQPIVQTYGMVFSIYTVAWQGPYLRDSCIIQSPDVSWYRGHLPSTLNILSRPHSMSTTTNFEDVVCHAEVVLTLVDIQPPFTFDIGVIPSLFFVATRCRHPKIRRTPLSLIKNASAQENLMESPTYGKKRREGYCARGRDAQSLCGASLSRPVISHLCK